MKEISCIFYIVVVEEVVDVLSAQKGPDAVNRMSRRLGSRGERSPNSQGIKVEENKRDKLPNGGPMAYLLKSDTESEKGQLLAEDEEKALFHTGNGPGNVAIKV